MPAPSRQSSLVRLLLQLRCLLTVIALALLLPGPLYLPALLSILGFAGLSLLTAYLWDRFAPYLRHHPVLITADILCSTVILLLAGPTSSFFFATVITAVVAGVLFGGRGVALVAALLVLGYAGSVAAHAGPAVLTTQVLVINPLLYPAAGFVGIRLRGVLSELAAEQAARQAAERTAAAAEERARLARDMHDSVAKTLRGTALAAQALPMWVAKDPQRALATAQQVAEAADIAAKEARQLISGLREDPDDSCLTEEIRRHTARWAEQTGLEAVVEHLDEDPGLEPMARGELLAVLSEALTNIERHAGARTAHVSLENSGREAVLRVRDDGGGFDAAERPAGHYGLTGMAERAARVGGTLDVVSAPNEGTTVLVRVPLPASTRLPHSGAPN